MGNEYVGPISNHSALTSVAHTEFFHRLRSIRRKDRADAGRVAHQASRYLQQTQDIQLVINRFAVKDYLLKGIVNDSPFSVLAALEDSDLIKKLDRKTQEEFYIAGSNWMYFALIYTCTQKPKKNDYRGEDLVFPPGVEKLMRGKPMMSNLLPDPGDAPKPKTVEDVRKLTVDIKKVNSIYRRHLTFLKKMPYNRYLDLIKKFDKDAELFKQDVSTCDGDWDCAGLPHGSRIIFIGIVPVFWGIVFARVNGRMKIIHIMQTPGD